LRLYVRAQKLDDGRVVLNAAMLNSVKDTLGSLNFVSLRGAVNHANTIYAVSSRPTGLMFDSYTQTNRPVIFWQERNVLGATWPPSHSGVAVTLAQVNPFQSAREAAATMAHELYGHAYACAQGLPCGHSSIPYFVFQGIENEAYTNFDTKP
jgi:hypothetical protein